MRIKSQRITESIGMLVSNPGTAPVVLPKISPEIAAEIEAKVAVYVDHLITLDPHSAQFEAEITSVHHLGDVDVRASAAVSNRLLDKAPASMSANKLNAYAKIPTDLKQLREVVEKLDPIRQGLMGERKLWNRLPWGDKVGGYFKKYDSAQGHLNAILKSLYIGQEDLAATNGSLEEEKANLWKIKSRLEECAYMVGSLEEHLTQKIGEIRETQPETARRLEDDALFYVKQKHQDVLTQIAVSAQSILAMDVIQKNNFELIKGVNRTTTTTVSALRTGIIIAQALYHQRNILTQIKAINGTASHLIEKTSIALKDQSGDVHDQAASATLDIEKIRGAFANAYDSIDSIDTFKAEALKTMGQTVKLLSGEVERAQKYLTNVMQEPGLPALPKESDEEDKNAN
jgi:uncharacterized protein YaaN involved in tellurite resistance